jgi:hypothetical protein
MSRQVTPSSQQVSLISSLIGRAKVVRYEQRNKYLIAHLNTGVSFWVLNK